MVSFCNKPVNLFHVYTVNFILVDCKLIIQIRTQYKKWQSFNLSDSNRKQVINTSTMYGNGSSEVDLVDRNDVSIMSTTGTFKQLEGLIGIRSTSLLIIVERSRI